MNKIVGNNPSKLKRNIFLTVLLILIILANTFVGLIFFLNLVGVADGAYATMSQAMVIVSFIISIGNVICGYAIWSWRKWGVIGYGVLVLTGFIVTGIVTKDFSNFYSLVGLTILSILIYPYWKFMK
jgi:hypothetical protein